MHRARRYPGGPRRGAGCGAAPARRRRLWRPLLRAPAICPSSNTRAPQPLNPRHQNPQVMTTYDREWDRRLSTTLGVANSRLYELRLQSANDNFEDVSSSVVRAVQESFRVREVDA